jgi:hypothetical protein
LPMAWKRAPVVDRPAKVCSAGRELIQLLRDTRPRSCTTSVEIRHRRPRWDPSRRGTARRCLDPDRILSAARALARGSARQGGHGDTAACCAPAIRSRRAPARHSSTPRLPRHDRIASAGRHGHRWARAPLIASTPWIRVDGVPHCPLLLRRDVTWRPRGLRQAAGEAEFPRLLSRSCAPEPPDAS